MLTTDQSSALLLRISVIVQEFICGQMTDREALNAIVGILLEGDLI